MKVLLLIPPRHQSSAFLRTHYLPPVGLAYCASYALEKAEKDHFPLTIEILDCNISGIGFKEFEDSFHQIDPDIIGISFFTENRFEAFETIDIIKRIKPSAVIVAGGAHATLACDDTIRHVPGLDYIVRGEGEATFYSLLHNLYTNGDITSVKGISYKHNDAVIHNPNNELITDLDSIPFPAYSLLDMKKYYSTLDWDKTVEKMGMIFTSRGCPFRCNFCSSSNVWGNSYRMRSPDTIIKELQFLKDTYGFSSFMFFDDTMTINRNRALEICQKIIDANLNISWKTHARVDTMDLALMTAMKNAGCNQIMFGVESGSQRILNEIIGKKINLNEVEQASALSNQIGMENNFSYIVGHPTETMEDAEQTLSLIKKHLADNQTVHLNFMRIYPSTGIETYAQQHNLLPPGFRWSKKFEFEAGIISKTLKGDVPMLRDKLTWNQMFDINSRFMRMTNYPIYRHAFDALKNIRSFRDLWDLITMGTIYMATLFSRR